MANLHVEFKGNGIVKIWAKPYIFECFTIPRKSIASSIPDMHTQMAVYFLVNSSEGSRDKRQIYIGKTSNGMTRFFSHKREKKWWNKIYLFTASKKVFDEDTILGLENLLITKYKGSNLYLMDQEGSNKDIDEECEDFGEQIIGIMDFFGYSLEAEESNDDDARLDISTKEETALAEETSNLFNKLDKCIKDLSPNISTDQLKLYTAYKCDKRNVCAVWVRSYGLEIELYISLSDISAQDTGAYDITSRKRGRRASAIKVYNKADLEKAMLIIKQIIDRQ